MSEAVVINGIKYIPDRRGRPKSGKVDTCVRMLPSHKEHCKAVGGGNLTLGLEMIIQEHMEEK